MEDNNSIISMDSRASGWRLGRFLIMSMTFGGLRTPLIILSSMLFVPVGALSGLLVTGQTLSMSAMIGMPAIYQMRKSNFV